MSSIAPEETSVPASPLSVGTALQAARQQTGKSLPEVAGLLRIRQPFLLALEEGRHKDLPGITYAVGFLRSYAEFLGLDGEEMVRRFRIEASGNMAARTELIFPSPVSEGRIPGGAVLFVGLMVAGLAYGGWYLLSSRDASVAEMVPALPDRLTSVLNKQAAIGSQSNLHAPVETTLAKPDAAAKGADAAAKSNEMVPPPEDEDSRAIEPVKPAEVSRLTEPHKPVETVKPAEPHKPAETAKPAEPPKPAETVKPAEPPKPAETAKPAEPPKPAETAKPAEPPKPAETAKPAEPPKPVETAKPAEPPKPAEGGESRIHLTAANDDCWVQIREMDGQLLLSRLLRKGDGFAVPNRPGLTLMVGNAGALDVVVDGRKTPSLGAPGQVRRDIRLDPDRLGG